MLKFKEFSRLKSRLDYLIILIIISSIGFTLIAYFSMLIFVKLNIKTINLNFNGTSIFIFFILTIPFITGGFFSLILDRSISQEKIQNSLLLSHCIICLLPLKNNVIKCNHCNYKYHSWHQVKNHNQKTNKCMICEKFLSKNDQNIQKISKKPNNIVIIDGANLACDSRPATVENIKLAQELLIAKGFEVICFVSPSLKYRILEEERSEFINDIERGRYIQTPAKAYDDKFILEAALKFNGYVLSNDKFSDIIEYKDKIQDRRMTFTLVKDEIIIDFKNYASKKP